MSLNNPNENDISIDEPKQALCNICCEIPDVDSELQLECCYKNICVNCFIQIEICPYCRTTFTLGQMKSTQEQRIAYNQNKCDCLLCNHEHINNMNPTQLNHLYEVLNIIIEYCDSRIAQQNNENNENNETSPDVPQEENENDTYIE